MAMSLGLAVRAARTVIGEERSQSQLLEKRMIS
jgi:hypothetical protein